MVYLSFAQSIITYCIRSWGGAAKTTLLELERAQRMLLKVIYFKPRLYPTVKLHSDAKVLSVRQLYILGVTLHQHALIDCQSLMHNAKVRRFHRVCEVTQAKTVFAQRFFSFRACRLYNLLHNTLQILKLTKREVKNK